MHCFQSALRKFFSHSLPFQTSVGPALAKTQRQKPKLGKATGYSHISTCPLAVRFCPTVPGRRANKIFMGPHVTCSLDHHGEWPRFDEANCMPRDAIGQHNTVPNREGIFAPFPFPDDIPRAISSSVFTSFTSVPLRRSALVS